MDKTHWHPGSLLQISGSYWQACTLHAGVKLGIFSMLDEQALGAKQLAATMRLDLRGLTILLNALVSMDLLLKKEFRFQLTDAAQRYLVKSSPNYVGHMILHHHHLVMSWAQLDVAVSSGLPIRASVGDEENAARREAFLMGMYNIASLQAPEIATQISLHGHKRLLDLGGGPGTYAIHFCLQNPELSAVIFDLPTTQPFAEKTVGQHGLGERITFEPGNYLKEDIDGCYDVIWLSHILHAEGVQACEALVEKAANLIRPGGIMLVHDFILNDSMDGPLFPALFALNMLQGTRDGQSYSETQIRNMMTKVGLGDIERLDYCGPTESGIMKGVKI